MIAGLRAGKLPISGMGANFWSMIHGEDLARACVLAAEARPAGETFLVVDDEPVRWRDLFAFVARKAGGPRPRYLPPAVARFVTGAVSADLLTTSLRCRNGKLKRQLGWQPRFPNYRDGLSGLMM